MIDFNRRDFIISTLAGIGTFVGHPLFRHDAFAKSQRFHNYNKSNSYNDTIEPHFFLTINAFAGIDPTYMFDARPLEMTATGLLQNYTNEEPILWKGINGQSCYASTHAHNKLYELKNDFSIINGVVMAHNFDGHDQNINFLLAGDSFGGSSFIPHLNKSSLKLEPCYLDTVQNLNYSFESINNLNSTVTLTSIELSKLIQNLKNILPALESSYANNYISKRYEALSIGTGRFSRANDLLVKAQSKTLSFGKQLSEVNLSPEYIDETDYIDFLNELFKKGICQSGAISLDVSENFDTHSYLLAKEQPKTYSIFADKIASIIKKMKSISFDSKRSMYDVTTFTVFSEFSRTMKQTHVPFAETGTDHNPLSNSIIIGGKGIRGGLVIGASDYENSKSKLSPAHLLNDKEKIKFMGRPFDFNTGNIRTDLPINFELADYLSIGSVINTIYQLFDVNKENYRTIGRTNSYSKVISQLLV